MAQQQIVILGGGYAGLMAGIRLAKKSKNMPVKITLVNATETLVHRIQMHQVATQQKIAELHIPTLFKGTGIEFVQGMINDIDLEAKQVKVTSAQDEQWLSYDKLVYALGSMTNRDSIKGVRDYAYTLDWQSVQKLVQVLPIIASKKGRVVVIGSGATGLETASEFAETYPDLQVEVVTQGTLAQGYLSTKGVNHVRKVFNQLNITLHEHMPVAEITDSHIIGQAGKQLAYDAVIWTGGFVANPLAKQVGFAVNELGQIKVDPQLHALSHPDVYVAGDAADVPTMIDTRVRMSCFTSVSMGTGVANNLLDELQGKDAQVFSITYAGLCLSLGRNNGLLQFLHHDDSPRDRIITGRVAVIIKEAIVKNLPKGISLEKHFPVTAWWPGKNRLKNKDSKAVSGEWSKSKA